MKFYISTQAQKYAEEVRLLLREYSAAGYSPGEVLFSVTVGFKPEDLRAFANRSEMPVRVRGKLLPVSEKAAAIVASVCDTLQEMSSDGVSDPAGLCVEPLGYILSGLRDRKTVTITLINPWSGELRLSMPGKEPQTHNTDPIYVSCVALGMLDREMEQLQDAIRLDHGELIPA